MKKALKNTRGLQWTLINLGYANYISLLAKTYSDMQRMNNLQNAKLKPPEQMFKILCRFPYREYLFIASHINIYVA